MSQEFTQDQKRALKSKAHALKPVVMVAEKGLSENVLHEINQALTAHELIKVRVSGFEREERLAMANEICEKFEATLIQTIGHILVIYKKNEKKRDKKTIRPKTPQQRRKEED
jgi:RNA-binding protein